MREDVMDREFIDLVLKERFNFQGEQRKNFLADLKNHPEKVQAFIADQLQGWAIAAALKLGKMVVVSDIDEDIANLIEEMRRYFASELDALPA